MITHLNWLVPALLSAVFWSAISIFDKYSVHSIFTKASQGLLISSLFSGFALLAMGSEIPAKMPFFLFFLAGCLLQISQWFYFRAMEDEDVGDLTAYGSSYPLVVALFSQILGKGISLIHWIGILAIIIGVIRLRYRSELAFTLKSIVDVSGYVFALAISSIIVDFALDFTSFRSGILPYSLGLVIIGILPMAFKNERKAAKLIFKKIHAKLWIFAAIELINLLAIFFEVYAIGIGHPALVNAIASSEPLFILIFSTLLSSFAAWKFLATNNRKSNRYLEFSLILIGIGIIAY